jgi:hypothetical protein
VAVAAGKAGKITISTANNMRGTKNRDEKRELDKGHKCTMEHG